MKKNIHVVPGEGNWKVEREDSKRSSGNFPTQKEAFERGRELAKKDHGELSLHGRNGQIRDKRSYGTDPFSPRG